MNYTSFFLELGYSSYHIYLFHILHMNTFESLTITCKDGYSLSGRFYAASATQKKNYPVLICPATGITQNFYHAFAEWLITQGYEVLSFDFRAYLIELSEKQIEEVLALICYALG